MGHPHLPSGKHTKNYGKSQCLMDNSTTSMAIFNSYFDITRGYRNLQIPPGTPHPRRVGTPRHGGALQRRQLRAAGAAHGRGRRGRGVGGTRPNLVSRDWREHFFRIYPLVNIQKAIEHGHRNSWFTHWTLVIFHRFFVCLPEGTMVFPMKFHGSFLIFFS